MKPKPHHKRHRYEVGREDIDAIVHKLVREIEGETIDARFLEEMIVTALKLGQDDLELGDVKMINTAMKELRYALKVFYPFSHVRKVAIFGSARTPTKDPAYIQAKEFSKAIVQAGWMVITGAAAGIMNAGNEGAGRANSFGVNIRLPFEQEANPVIKEDLKLINFKYFFTRKLIFVRESDATVLCPGGFGTHDEGFETLTLIQTGKTTPRPVVCLDPPGSKYWSSWKHFLINQLMKKHMIEPEDMKLIHFTHDIQDAVNVITTFYRNYHSLRYIGERLVLRIKKPLLAKQLVQLNDEFKGIIKRGKIQQHLKPFPEESGETHTLDLPRLGFYFNRRHFSRLKLMIDEINRM